MSENDTCTYSTFNVSTFPPYANLAKVENQKIIISHHEIFSLADHIIYKFGDSVQPINYTTSPHEVPIYVRKQQDIITCEYKEKDLVTDAPQLKGLTDYSGI